VPRYVYAWRDSGLWKTINHLLRTAVRLATGREASPSAGVIDSWSVKTTGCGEPRGGACPRAGRRLDAGDAGKKIEGRKRHILTDPGGLLVAALVHTADIQDRHGAPDVPASTRQASRPSSNPEKCFSSSASRPLTLPRPPRHSQLRFGGVDVHLPGDHVRRRRDAALAGVAAFAAQTVRVVERWPIDVPEHRAAHGPIERGRASHCGLRNAL
jgi:transposase